MRGGVAKRLGSRRARSGSTSTTARHTPRAIETSIGPRRATGSGAVRRGPGTGRLPHEPDELCACPRRGCASLASRAQRQGALHVVARDSERRRAARGRADRPITDEREYERAAEALVRRAAAWLEAHGLAGPYDIDHGASTDRARLWWSPPRAAQIHGSGRVVGFVDLLNDADEAAERAAIVAESGPRTTSKRLVAPPSPEYVRAALAGEADRVRNAPRRDAKRTAQRLSLFACAARTTDRRGDSRRTHAGRQRCRARR